MRGPHAFPRVWRPLAVLGLAWGLGGSAWAGLFDDEEARKAILDLRGKVEELRQLSTTNQKQLTDQVQQLQRSLLELNNQNEQLRAEIARLRGQEEQTQRELADAQRRLKDVSTAVEDRLRKFEPQKVSVDGREFMADPEEKRAYDEAMAVMKSGDFDKASATLSAFLRRFPTSGYGDTARYWLGNALYAKRDFKEAANTFRHFQTTATEHPRAAEALLALANCQVELKDPKAARRILEDVVKAYPDSEAAEAAKERLTTLK